MRLFFRAGNRILWMLEGSLMRKEKGNHISPARRIAETQSS
jgi:hypothetical protein